MRDFDRALHNNWDRTLEGNLPDSRLTGPRRRATTIMRGGMKYELVYCANCGCSGGCVNADWTPHIFYLCDRCFLDGKAPVDAVMVDESKVNIR
jgi:hypothetical protein